MPTLETLMLFTAAAIAITLVPGPSMLYVLSKSIAQGKAVGALSALGLETGLCIHTIGANLGLSAIFLYSPLIFMIIKYLGAVYLIYLGIQMIISKKTSFHSEEKRQKKKYSWSYSQGILTEVLNPKTSLFFLSFLPQFVDPAQDSAALQMLMLGSILILIALSADLLIAISGAVMSKWLTGRPVYQKIQQWMAGTVLIGLGIRLAISRRE